MKNLTQNIIWENINQNLGGKSHFIWEEGRVAGA
jgi:hypothetical protein